LDPVFSDLSGTRYSPSVHIACVPGVTTSCVTGRRVKVAPARSTIRAAAVPDVRDLALTTSIHIEK